MLNILFENKGLIDPGVITSFGVSVKETDSAIGMFGTGLKYALAVLLRTGHKVVLYRGMQRHTFSVRDVEVRGHTQRFVYMGNKRLAFTTHLGHTWELWQAFRELHCNAMDEGGVTRRTNGMQGKEGQTRIYVVGEAFQAVFDERDTYILPRERVPLWRDDNIEIYSGASKGVFYRGMRALQLQKPSLYTYNVLTSISLTEDRTITYPWAVDSRVAMAVQGAALPHYDMGNMLLAPEGTFEHGLTFSPSCAPSDSFLKTCADNVADYKRLNRTAYAVYRGHAAERGALDTKPIEGPDAEMLERAVSLLKRQGADVTNFPVHVVPDLGEGVLGLAERGCIIISYECFLRGDRTLIGTLYEEYVHLKHGLDDCSRGLQNHLLDRLVTAWVLEDRFGEVEA